jgi:hypothetical protein
VWGGDQVCRAVARRAGARVVESLADWLAHAALLDGGVEPGAEVTILVLGGGTAYVADEARTAGLAAQVVGLDDRSPEAVEAVLAERPPSAEHALVLVAGAPPLALPAAAAPRVLPCDLRQPEHFRALLGALAQLTVREALPPPRARVDKALVERVREEIDGALSDHDAKRLLKAYGARVTRQAPTATPTGAVKLARTIGLPVELVGRGGAAHLAATLPDVRRIASLLLQEGSPSVMVRERFPESPRARARAVLEKGLGLTLRVGDTCALAPLSRADAQELASATPARRAPDQRAVAELLLKIAACAAGEGATFELELFVGAEPAVLAAEGSLGR